MRNDRDELGTGGLGLRARAPGRWLRDVYTASAIAPHYACASSIRRECADRLETPRVLAAYGSPLDCRSSGPCLMSRGSEPRARPIRETNRTDGLAQRITRRGVANSDSGFAPASRQVSTTEILLDVSFQRRDVPPVSLRHAMSVHSIAGNPRPFGRDILC